GLDQAPHRPGSARENGIRDYQQCDGRRPYQLLMKRLAVFMGPIKETTFQHSWNLAENEWNRYQAEDKNLQGLGKFPDWEVMWDELLKNKLLFQIVRRPSAKKSCVMHAVVREFVFHHFHQADAHKLATFTQT